MSRRVVCATSRDIARRGTERSRGRTVWIREDGRDRKRDRGALDRVCDRVVLDAGGRSGDTSHDELSPVFRFRFPSRFSCLTLGEPLRVFWCRLCLGRVRRVCGHQRGVVRDQYVLFFYGFILLLTGTFVRRSSPLQGSTRTIDRIRTLLGSNVQGRMNASSAGSVVYVSHHLSDVITNSLGSMDISEWMFDS